MIAKIRYILLLLVLLPLAGCFREDYSFCPPDIIKLDFRLTSGESFKENVYSVEVGIFDGDGNFIRSERVEQSAINEFEGMLLSLDPGNYRLVFWGNVNGDTKIDGIGTVSPQVVYSEIAGTDPGNVIDAEKLYYAPYGTNSQGEKAPLPYYALTVPATGSYTDIVYFTPAHRSLKIYIEGLEGLPTVDIQGLPAGLDYFGMEELTRLVNTSHRTSLTDKEGTTYATTAFDTFHFNDLEEIYIVIRDEAGNVVLRVSLADAVEQSGADPDDIILELVFRFSPDPGSGNYNVKVDITMPDWDSEDTEVDLKKSNYSW
jgi:hypothetical protein